MPDPRRALGRLTAKTSHWPDPDAPPPSTLLEDKLTQADVLGALGMTHSSRVGQGILLAQYAGDRSMLIEVHEAGLTWAIFLAKERRWREGPRSIKVILRLLVSLAIEELVAPQLCRTCHGHGEIFHKKRFLIEDCQVCGGAGIRDRSDRARARFIHVDYRAWRRRWRARYALVHRPLAQAAGVTLSRLSLKLQ